MEGDSTKKESTSHQAGLGSVWCLIGVGLVDNASWGLGIWEYLSHGGVRRSGKSWCWD